MSTPHDYEDSDAWYAALKRIARSHDNQDAVRDFDGWTEDWEQQTPAQAYYSEFPEHNPGAVPVDSPDVTDMYGDEPPPPDTNKTLSPKGMDNAEIKAGLRDPD